MSYTLDSLYNTSAYRKVLGDPQRNVSRSTVSLASSGFHSQPWSRGSTTSSYRRGVGGYSQISSTDSLDCFNGEPRSRNEKEMLQALNDRFAVYIDKVRQLEIQNKNLEAEAAALRQSQAGKSAIGELYEREIGDLRGILVQLTNEKTQVQLEQEHIEEDIQHVKQRFEDEARAREEVQAAIRAMTKYIDESGLSRLELDKKLQSLQEEAAFLKKNHEEEVGDLLSQIHDSQVTVDVRESVKSDVTSALREIRAQLDGHASKTTQHAEEWFQGGALNTISCTDSWYSQLIRWIHFCSDAAHPVCRGSAIAARLDKLSEAAKYNSDAIRSAQDEISEHRRQLQSRTTEMETLKGTRDSLERQRSEIEAHHHGEVTSLQETIQQLDNELRSTKWEMSTQLRDYQDLLNVKMALDIEIAAYRKLLEGEETRFSSGLGPYSYIESHTKIASSSRHLKIKTEDKVKAAEKSDTVIVEEQTDETQVEVTEGGEETEKEGEAEEEKAEEEVKSEGEKGEEEEGKEGEEEEGEVGGEAEEGGEEAAEEDEKEATSPEAEDESKAKSPEAKSPEATSPTGDKSKSPEPKSPEAKSPAEDKSKSLEPKSPVEEKTKSPTEEEAKSPAEKSPEAKSPTEEKSKSPEAKSPTEEKSKSPEAKLPAEEKSKSPEAKSPTEEKSKSPEAKSPAEEKAKYPEEEQPKAKVTPPKEDKKKEPEPEKEEKPESKKEEKEKPKEKELVKKAETKEEEKESKPAESPKKAQAPKIPTKPEEKDKEPVKEKPKPEAKADEKEKAAPKVEEKEKASPKKEEKEKATPKADEKEKSAPKEEAVKTEEKEKPKKEDKPKEDVKPVEKKDEAKKAPEKEEKKPEAKKEEKKAEPKKEVKKEETKKEEKKEPKKEDKAKPEKKETAKSPKKEAATDTKTQKTEKSSSTDEKETKTLEKSGEEIAKK